MNRNILIVIYPTIPTRPVFNLVDEETGVERKMTDEESILLDSYQSAYLNWQSIISTLESWGVRDSYINIMSERGLSYTKDEIDYSIQFFNATKFSHVENITEASVVTVVVSYNKQFDWLSENGYERKVTGE